MVKEDQEIKFRQLILEYRGVVLRVFAMLLLFLVGIIIYKHFNPFTLPLGIERRTLFVLIPLGLLNLTLYFPYNWAATRLKSLSVRWIKFLQAEAKKEDLGGAERKGEFAGSFSKINRIPVVRWLIRWMYKERWRYSFLLFLTLLACFVIRYYFASIGNINLDEGNGLYDANLILQGEIPFKDYSTRSPGYLYTLALFIKVFGYSIMTGRLLAIISGTAICFFLFLISKELYNKNVGLIAALIYCLSPFFIYYGIIGYLRTACLVWVLISVYFLILAIKEKRLKHFFLSGLFIGIAMLFYRGHLVYLILCPLALVCIHPWEFKNLFRNTVLVSLGFCLPVIPTLAYFHYAPPGFITTIAATGVMGEEVVSYALAKSRVLYCLFRGALYLFIPMLLFLMLSLKKWVKDWRPYISLVIIVWGLILAAVVKGRFVGLYTWGLTEMPANYVPIFFSLLISISLVSISLLITGKFNLKPDFRSANTFLILFFFCASIFFLMSPANSSIGVIPATIMAAITISVIFQWQKGRISRILSTIFLILLILSAVLAVFIFANTPEPGRGIEISTLKEVGEYINAHTQPDEEIFTCIPAFAVQANRRIIFDISHPLTYVSSADHPWGGYDPYGTTPSTSEIAKYMESNKIKYIVLEERARSIVGHHPELAGFINANYRVVARYHDMLNTQILAWGR